VAGKVARLPEGEAGRDLADQRTDLPPGQQGGEVERAFLAELAALLGDPEATLIDSHHICPESPIEHCVFEITASRKDPGCLFCGGSIYR